MVINQTLLSLLVLSFPFLGVFYYTLGNISPKHRSQLKAMQLLAIAKRPVIKKNGCNEILRTFMTQLAQLEQVRYFINDNNIAGLKVIFERWSVVLTGQTNFSSNSGTEN